jgi:hypothetical protein
MFFAAVIARVVGQASRHGEMGPRSWRRGVLGRSMPLLDGRSKGAEVFLCGNMGSRTRDYCIVHPMVADGPGGDR